jgi:hypothetical protein
LFAARCAIAGVVLIGASIDEPEESPPPSLFSFAARQGELPQYLASWAVEIDQDAVQQPALLIVLNLPDREPIAVTLVQWEARSGYVPFGGEMVPDPNAQRSDFSWRWYGQSEGGYTVALTMEKGNLAGRIWAPGNVHYALEPNINGTVLGMTNSDFWVTHPSGWDESREDAEPPSPDEISAKSTGVLSPLGSWDLTCAGPLPTGYHPVDVLVMYTPNLIGPPPIGYGSVGALTAAVQSGLDDANQALRNVGVRSYSYLLRGVELADPNNYSGVTIVDALDLFSGIARVTPPASPWCTYPGNSYVSGRRTTMWSDIVALARRDATGENSCGVSRAQRHVEFNDCPRDPGPGDSPFAYMVFDPGCNADRLNMAHELGHLLGMEHDPHNAKNLSPPNKPSCPWSFGHRRPDGASRFHFRTIMAYPTDAPGGGGLAGPSTCSTPANCPQIDAYSHPLLEWDGENDGINTPHWGLQTLGSLAGAWPVGDITNPTWRDSHATDTLPRLAPVVEAFLPRPNLIFKNGFDK